MTLTALLYDQLQLTGQTTDAATAQNLGTYTVPDGYVASAIAIVTFAKDASTAGAVTKGAVARATGGAATQIGSTQTPVALQADAAVNTVSITMDCSGATLRVRANGVAATTINYGGLLDITLYKP